MIEAVSQRLQSSSKSCSRSAGVSFAMSTPGRAMTITVIVGELQGAPNGWLGNMPGR
jgi:hypothetical protein